MKPFTIGYKFVSKYCEECRKEAAHYLTRYDLLVCNDCYPRRFKKVPSYKQKLL